MKLTEAYTVFNNNLHSMDPQLAEAIDRILDDKNKQLEKLDQVELAEAKARMEIERLQQELNESKVKQMELITDKAYEKSRKQDYIKTVHLINEENKRLREALDVSEKHLMTTERHLRDFKKFEYQERTEKERLREALESIAFGPITGSNIGGINYKLDQERWRDIATKALAGESK